MRSSKIEFILFLTITYTVTTAQKALPLAQESSVFNEETKEWEVVRKHFFSYDRNGKEWINEGVHIRKSQVNIPFKTERQYYLSGELISEIILGYDYQMEHLDTNTYRLLNYNKNRQLEMERIWYQNQGTKHLKLHSKREYLYNEQGCLRQTNEYDLRYDRQTESYQLVPSKRISYERDMDCKIVAEEYAISDRRRYEYRYNLKGNLEEKRTYRYERRWILTERERHEYDSENRITSTRTEQYEYGLGVFVAPTDTTFFRSFYEYDGGRLDPIKYVREEQIKLTRAWEIINYETFFYDQQQDRLLPLYRESHSGSFIFEDSYTYEYDNQNFLVSKTSLRRVYRNANVNGLLKTKYTYTNRCDGAVLSEVEQILNSFPSDFGNPKYKKEYTYGKSAFCEEINTATANFKAYPNPANTYTIIESELLRESETLLELRALDGQLIYQRGVLHSLRQTLDLSNLPNGMYYIKLYNPAKDLQTQTKLIVAK